MADLKLLSNATDRNLGPISEPDLNQHPLQPSKRRSSTTLLFQIFCIIWLVPIVALLWLNFSNYIIGASAWCT
jgi:hypothetical protein